MNIAKTLELEVKKLDNKIVQLQADILAARRKRRGLVSAMKRLTPADKGEKIPGPAEQIV